MWWRRKKRKFAIKMGGMPMLEVKNWLHEVNGLYLTLIPSYIWINNFVGPRAMEPVFTKDFLMAQFEKIASSTAAAPSQTTQVATAKTAFTPTPGKVPVLPKNMFARAVNGNPRGRLITFASAGLLAFVPSSSSLEGN